MEKFFQKNLTGGRLSDFASGMVMKSLKKKVSGVLVAASFVATSSVQSSSFLGSFFDSLFESGDVNTKMCNIELKTSLRKMVVIYYPNNYSLAGEWFEGSHERIQIAIAESDSIAALKAQGFSGFTVRSYVFGKTEIVILFPDESIEAELSGGAIYLWTRAEVIKIQLYFKETRMRTIYHELRK
ncbi:MAG: hypothetical protein LBF34_02570 [Puniceicoccales bacterium]|nr:hypothetical protein [Puniceicoccales bacterium]